jgi:hypothetical protein
LAAILSAETRNDAAKATVSGQLEGSGETDFDGAADGGTEPMRRPGLVADSGATGGGVGAGMNSCGGVGRCLEKESKNRRAADREAGWASVGDWDVMAATAATRKTIASEGSGRGRRHGRRCVHAPRPDL